MSKNLKLFETTSEYEAYINGGGAILPNVSRCKDNPEVYYYNPIPHDYSKDYLTFVALENGTFSFSFANDEQEMFISVDDGLTWSRLVSGTESPIIEAGKKILWKCEAEAAPEEEWDFGYFNSTGRFDIEGNIMSILFGDNFNGQTDLSELKWTFYELFGFNRCQIVNCANLTLPATSLPIYSYRCMFEYCENLVTSPKSLPATTLSEGCYKEMFSGCTSLTKVPELPATTLVDKCYQEMLTNCTSLETAPELPATTLANNCYDSMFSGCTNLVNAPSILPAATLATECYSNMFYGCSSLTKSPDLPATTFTKNVTNNCYFQMFMDCTSLNSIKAMLISKPDSAYTKNWVKNVPSDGGTFYKNSAATWDNRGTNAVPNNWQITYVDA